jgi:hypothetical protein
LVRYKSRSSKIEWPENPPICGEILRQLREYWWATETDSEKESDLLEKRLHFAKKLHTQLKQSQKLFGSIRKSGIAASRESSIPGPDQIISTSVKQLQDWIKANQTLLNMTRGSKARQRTEHFSHFDELVCGVYLHLRKVHFDKSVSERFVLWTIATILKSADIPDVTRGKESTLSSYRNSATPLRDTPIGMRLSRIFKNSKMKKETIKNFPALPCDLPPITELPEEILNIMDESQKYRFNLSKSRP